VEISQESRKAGIQELTTSADGFVISLNISAGLTQVIRLCPSCPPWLTAVMKITKNIGMLLLAVYLIVDGLLGFGLNIGPAIFLLYIVALAAGIFILIGK
jgi:hypothetical protein